MYYIFSYISCESLIFSPPTARRCGEIPATSSVEVMGSHRRERESWCTHGAIWGWRDLFGEVFHNFF
jgi:hypothetical protein